jgi:hypothetical protein
LRIASSAKGIRELVIRIRMRRTLCRSEGG